MSRSVCQQGSVTPTPPFRHIPSCSPRSSRLGRMHDDRDHGHGHASADHGRRSRFNMAWPVPLPGLRQGWRQRPPTICTRPATWLLAAIPHAPDPRSHEDHPPASVQAVADAPTGCLLYGDQPEWPCHKVGCIIRDRQARRAGPSADGNGTDRRRSTRCRHLHRTSRACSPTRRHRLLGGTPPNRRRAPLAHRLACRWT